MVAAGVVQQDDRAVAPLLLDPLEDQVRPGPLPILGVDALHHGEIVEVLGDHQRRDLGQLVGPRVRLVGRAEQGGGTSRDRLDQPLGGIQFEAHALRADQGKVGMRVGVAADLVPLRHDPPDDPRIVFRLLAQQEERGVRSLLFENIQDFGESTSGRARRRR